VKSLPIKNIIVIALPGIGDTVNCTPLFKPLKRAFPDAHVTALVMYRTCKEVLDGNPYIDEIILWEFMKEGLISSIGFLRSLRSRGFDVSIMCYPANRIEYNVVSFIIGARLRLAHQYAHQNLRNLFFLNNRTLMERPELHNAQENLRLLSLLGVEPNKEDRALSLTLGDEDRASASKFLQGLPPHEYLVCMHVWSTTLKNMHMKCWPIENFAALADMLGRDFNCQILLLQGPNDVEANRKLMQASHSRLHVVEGTTVRQSASLLERCDLFITNDSGPMHIAAAAGAPILAVFGPTDPVKLHPWTGEYRIVRTGIDCSPCFYYSPRPLNCKRTDYACLTQLSVDAVYAAAREMLGKRKSG
jgi:heptosyltransferase-2